MGYFGISNEGSRATKESCDALKRKIEPPDGDFAGCTSSGKGYFGVSNEGSRATKGSRDALKWKIEPPGGDLAGRTGGGKGRTPRTERA